MTEWVQIVLTISHAFFLPVLIGLFRNFRHVKATAINTYIPFGLLCCVTMCSSLMHFSETKKELNPTETLRPYALMFLNMDRFFAVITSLYMAWFSITYHSYLQIRRLFLGFCLVGLFSLAGELFDSSFSYVPYVSCHLIWHFGVAALAYVALLFKPSPKSIIKK